MKHLLFYLLGVLSISLSVYGAGINPAGAYELQSITIIPDAIDVKEGTIVQLQATGHYDNGADKNLTTKVAWTVENNATASVDVNGTMTALREGSAMLKASLNNAEGNASVVVYKEINGHRLPPEPDPAINNSTLLGIDSNHNDVRDDVERWIYMRYNTYLPCKLVETNVTIPATGKTIQGYEKVCEKTRKPYHQIVREIAMQGARAAQIIIQDPEKARETMKYMDDAVRCSSYFSAYEEFSNSHTLFDLSIENDSILGHEFDTVQFNTVLRVRAYAKYNMALSGGVYGGSFIDMQNSCDFNVAQLLNDSQ